MSAGNILPGYSRQNVSSITQTVSYPGFYVIAHFVAMGLYDK